MNGISAREANAAKGGIATLPATVLVGALIVALLTIPFGGNITLPHWINWESSLSSYDLDGDGAEESLFVYRGSLAVHDGMHDARIVTPRSWHVSNAFVNDLDRDGTPEIILMAWRRGSYGSAHPFWVSLNSSGFSQHVFVFNYENAQLNALWMSSALGFEAHDPSVDGEGVLHLVTEEGQPLSFAWESWGFTLVEDDMEAAR